MRDHIRFDDVDVYYERIGSGEQVVLAHALPFVGWYAPLAAALTDYAVLRYRRMAPLDGRQFGIDDDAELCARLLRHVGLSGHISCGTPMAVSSPWRWPAARVWQFARSRCWNRRPAA